MAGEDLRRMVRDDPRPQHAYSGEVRDAVAAYAERRRDQGARWREIQEEVGVSSTSIRNWMAAQKRGFQRVVVVEEPTPIAAAVRPSGLSITSPSGFVLTGCSLEQAVAALRALQ